MLLIEMVVIIFVYFFHPVISIVYCNDHAACLELKSIVMVDRLSSLPVSIVFPFLTSSLVFCTRTFICHTENGHWLSVKDKTSILRCDMTK